MSRVDTLVGVFLDEISNKKTYFKIKVGVLQMERLYLGITLENLSEKKEYADFKSSFKN